MILRIFHLMKSRISLSLNCDCPTSETVHCIAHCSPESAMMNGVQQNQQVNYVQFSEAHPNFNAYCVMGGFEFEGESLYTMRLFDSKQLSREYAENLILQDNFDYSIRFIISNDGTIWKMPGSQDTFTLKGDEIEIKTR